MRFNLTRISRNRKTGPIPVATASSDTCPDDCALKNAGCYAEHGPLRLHWRKVDRRGVDFAAFLRAVRALPRRQVWRYGQAGDLPMDKADVLALAHANSGRPVLCYSHRRDVETYRTAFSLGFLVNLSADSMEEADALVGHGLPVVCVLPSRYQRRSNEPLAAFRARLGGPLLLRTPAGHPVVICPATYADTDCGRCQACAKPRARGAIIGFPAHGSRKARIDGRIAEKIDKRPTDVC